MGFRCGIVGLPNVGKSTLFNALTATATAEAANYPFTTIEPNVGQVAVPDPRLDKVAAAAQSQKVVPTRLSFVDIAGLVRGASTGEGLGNQFLGHIREVDAVLHVLRCFEDSNVAHVDGRIDPVADAETLNTELLLADLERLERRFKAVQKAYQGGDKSVAGRRDIIERLLVLLGEGRPARDLERTRENEPILRELGLLTAKPVLYVCNVEESAVAGGEAAKKVQDLAHREGAATVVISAAIENEVAQLPDAGERDAFLAELGLAESGLARLVHAGYGLLDLITFFTAAPNEARAWTVSRGTRAPQAAGQIHSDFERGFIRAETIGWEDFVDLGGEQGAREAGKLIAQGKDYVVRDGDLLHFLTSA